MAWVGGVSGDCSRGVIGPLLPHTSGAKSVPRVEVTPGSALREPGVFLRRCLDLSSSSNFSLISFGVVAGIALVS